MILPNSLDFVGPVGTNCVSWQQHMKFAVRTAEELAKRLELPLDGINLGPSSGEFPLFVPLPYLSRIEKGNPDDPLLRQVLPTMLEEADFQGLDDPVSESDFVLAPGLLKKYAGRALIVVNGTCAVHCRYCFRRHFPYSDSSPQRKNWSSSLEKLANDPSIDEVILSGGDPLTLVDNSLASLLQEIEAVSHVSRVRIHTRLPIVIPQRVTGQLLGLIRESRLAVIVVVHCNHGNEIDNDVCEALHQLKSSANALLNQSVLLRGVNDCVESLAQLGRKLIEAGTVPYYLHQLDPVRGAAHFEVDVNAGRRLMVQLRKQLPGYMVPRYVQEIPGEPYKSLI